MKGDLSRFSVPLLRWTLGAVVLLESVEFVRSASAAHFLVKAGLPSWLQPVLGGGEIIAAILFLVPFTARLGAYLLLAVFALAAGVHLLHGQYGIGGLVVYAVIVLVCMSHAENKPTELHRERL